VAITLQGNWKAGKAYDLHTVSSAHLATDEFGHDRFDNARSEMGELVYQLKYRQNKAALPHIIMLLDAIFGVERFDVIVPVPPVNSRPLNAVELIAIALGDRRGVPVVTYALRNAAGARLAAISDPIEREAALADAFRLKASTRALAGKSVLVVDDLYRTGATLRTATSVLSDKGEAAEVSVLTMTKI